MTIGIAGEAEIGPGAGAALSLRTLLRSPVGSRFHQVCLATGCWGFAMSMVSAFGLLTYGGLFGETSTFVEFWHFAWFAAGALLFAVWLVRLVGFTFQSRVARSKPWRIWLIAPTIALATLALMIVAEPFSFAVYTRPSLDAAFVDTAFVDPSSPTAALHGWTREDNTPDQVGHYEIGEVFRSGSNVAFLDPNAGFIFARGGLAYLPDGPDDRDGWPWGGTTLRFDHRGGDWYKWSQSY